MGRMARVCRELRAAQVQLLLSFAVGLTLDLGAVVEVLARSPLAALAVLTAGVAAFHTAWSLAELMIARMAERGRTCPDCRHMPG